MEKREDLKDTILDGETDLEEEEKHESLQWWYEMDAQ